MQYSRNVGLELQRSDLKETLVSSSLTFLLTFACSNETSYRAVSCTMERSMWWGTKGSVWPIAKKELRTSVLQLMRNQILPPDTDELERLSLSRDVRWNPTKVTSSSQFSQDFPSMSNEVPYPRKPLSLEQPHTAGHPRSSPRWHRECSLLKGPEPDDQAKSHPD